MPELPEVETCLRGLAPHITQQTINACHVYERRLRWLVAPDLSRQLTQQTITTLQRRGKYLLFNTTQGTLILHLGMSGSLRLSDSKQPRHKHDHVELTFSNGYCLRFRDPRRFGSLHWTTQPATQHRLLSKLGLEPLQRQFCGNYLFRVGNTRNKAIKLLLMDNHIVVGIGNIYAQEALFAAKIHPARPANTIDQQRYNVLANAIKKVLRRAIAAGGTSLRDFVNSSGNPGYFKQQLAVYGRAGLACDTCRHDLQSFTIGQRSTVFCENCQH